MQSNSQNEASREGWHLDKKVPISIIFAIVLQCVSFTWFMGKQDARITLIEQSRVERISAQHDRDERQDQDTAARFEEVSKRLDKMDGKLDRLIERGTK